MAIKVVSMLHIFFLFSLAFSSIHSSSSSPFDFLKHLQGCHHGENLKGVHQLKQYLKKFGYLNYPENNTHRHNDNFDEFLDQAVKTYQLNYHLNATGTLDPDTVSKMMTPRCGNADIINGTTRMQGGKKMQNDHSHFINTVPHFSFFPGYPRWPATKTFFTYGFKSGTFLIAINPVARAFATWASVTGFSFLQIQDFWNADIRISFQRGDHGDGSPFDGPGGILAHAFAPTDGRFHYDADELWSVGGVAGAYDLESIALHEIGHLLGLMHSSVEGAIMYPTFALGSTKRTLHLDDIWGIWALYSL